MAEFAGEPRFCWQVPDKQTWSEHSKRAKWQVSVRRHILGCVLTNPHLSGCSIQSHVPRSPRPFHFLVVQLLSHLQLFLTPWTAAHQASLSITYLWEFAQTHNHWVHDAIQPFHPLSSPSPPAFSLSQHHLISRLFASGGQSFGALPSASVFPMNIQHWFPLRLTGLMSLLFKELSGIFSKATVQRHQFLSVQPFLLSCSHIRTWLLEKP